MAPAPWRVRRRVELRMWSSVEGEENRYYGIERRD